MHTRIEASANEPGTVGTRNFHTPRSNDSVRQADCWHR